MKLIDFDEKFRDYMTGWIRENAARYKTADALEAAAPKAYEDFTRASAAWLDGLSPQAYFAQMDDPEALVQMLVAYDEAELSPPDLLMERITSIGRPAVPPLLRLLEDEQACPCLRVTAANLLLSLGAKQAVPACLRIVEKREQADEVADAAAELLTTLGEDATPQMLDRLETASEAALETWLDILCNFPGDERIYQYTQRAFLNAPGKRALYASLLGKLGDERAIAPLTKVMGQADINYLEYLEIANAIDMLGGDAGDRNREFSGDPYYETLKQLE